MTDKTFRIASPADAARCFDVEAAGYNADEAATLEKISKRIAEHPQGFVLLETGGEIVGFINSGCTHEVEMSDEDIKDLIGHDPSAPHVVILSVVVDPAYQGLGLSTALMSEFVRRMEEAGKATIHLMCKRPLVPLYERFGYRYIKPSGSAHGGAEWHEMMMDLPKV